MLADNLKLARTRQNLTLKSIAKSVNSSIGYIHELETGIKTPSLEMLQKLAAALNVTPNDLLGVEVSTQVTSNHKGAENNDRRDH